MASTLLLDQSTWDFVLDANGNIAVAGAPYSLAQDAASAIQTYLGECYWDTTVGVPYLTQVFGQNPSVEALKSILVAAALTVEDVASAVVYIVASDTRSISGQVQVTSASTGQVAAAPFTTTSTQGAG